MKRNNVRIAVQKDGRLKNASLAFLKSCGLKFNEKNGRNLIIPCRNTDAEILYVRHGDIPQYLQTGAADFGIVGMNILFENKFDVKILRELGFGRCCLMIAVPEKSGVKNISELEGERIATSYPNSLRDFLKKQKINASVVEIRGAVEAAPRLGLADAICDITQTGKTLRENNLKILTRIYESEAVLIASNLPCKKKNYFLINF